MSGGASPLGNMRSYFPITALGVGKKREKKKIIKLEINTYNLPARSIGNGHNAGLVGRLIRFKTDYDSIHENYLTNYGIE